MKNKIFALLVVGLLGVGLIVGCSTKDDIKDNNQGDIVDTDDKNDDNNVDDTDNNQDDQSNQGIAVNDIKFEVLQDEDLSDEIKDFIEKNKSNKGYMFWEEDGIYTLYIGSGEKLTGGYAIEVESVKDNEGRTIVVVNETEPGEDAVVTEALTYPYTVIKLTGITDRFDIKNTKGESFEQYEKSQQDDEITVNALFTGRIDGNSIEATVNDTPTAFRTETEELKEIVEKLEDGQNITITYQENEHGQLIVSTIETNE